MVRAFGAFGLGLLLGALLGRSLHAFILGGLLSFMLVMGAGDAYERWLSMQPPTIVAEEQTGVTMGWAWRTPEGAQISNEQALALVPAEVSGQDPPEQPVYSMGWLQEHGYTLLALGVTEEVALGWATYDGLIFGVVGVASFAGAIAVVSRRRPT